MNTENSAQWAEIHIRMLRFARIQLNYADAAEDLVQEALLAAVGNNQQFKGEAQMETWVFAILKNKITDFLRKNRREQNVFQTSAEEQALDQAFEDHFSARGHWQDDNAPADWRTPEQSLSNRQFRDILQACLYGLPENTARVFMMREMLGLESSEICQNCGLTAANYYVVMHRAREGLRQCLQIKWFNQQS